MNSLFKLILISLILSSTGYSALTLTLNTPVLGTIDLGTVAPADGFYGSNPGNIELQCDTNAAPEPWSLNASITQELTSLEGYVFNSGSLKWKGYYIEHGNFTQADWSAYPLFSNGEDTIAISDGTNNSVDVTLGTLVYVPAVMPEGDYETVITFTLTP